VVALVVVAGASAWPGGVPSADTVVNLDQNPSIDPSLVAANATLPVMIDVAGQPSAVAFAHAGSHAAKVKAGKDQHAKNEQAQQAVLRALDHAKLGTKVLYHVADAYNGIAVLVSSSKLHQLAQVDGVQAIHRIPLQTPDNASSVPLIGAPTAWESYGKTGAGIRIGVIDTGIDYVHTNFGGPGTGSALTAARSAANNDPSTTLPIMDGATQLFPSAKVVGGYDFAGDAYNGGNSPQPDPNPEDCPSALGGGHGSHVSGTAAGYGVNSDGSTYTGSYDSSTPFSTMRIGPGVAPEAQLYALRVFGCGGSTSLTTAAIDWAMDPNGDHDFSDHLDVINMSLGSSYGTPDDPPSAASDNAAAAGVVVVSSAGNSGDVTYVTGSPASSTRTLSVAASVDATDVVDGIVVNSPGAIAGTYPGSRSANFDWAGSPGVTANLYYPATNQYGCNAFTGADLAFISANHPIVLLDWRKASDATSPCGSAIRANNAASAGAVGMIVGDKNQTFDTAIAGNSSIPAMYTNVDTKNALLSQLTPGVGSSVSVTLSKDYFNTGKLTIPGSVDTLTSFTSRGPRSRDNALKPDITAPGSGTFSTNAGTGNQGESLSGTSMASPHMAGVMALLREAHPSWSVEELKALAMDTASHGLYTGFNQSGKQYAPARVGAGRVDVPDAMAADAVAYADGGSGAVSVSFGALRVLGTQTWDRTIRVVNFSGSDKTYTIGYNAQTFVPGVFLAVPGGTSLTVPAGGSATFTVRLSADASQMKNTRDSTMDAAQGGNPRQWLSEASGLVTLTPSSGPTLRVPVYAALRPASTMGTTESDLLMTAPTGSSTLHLSGTGVSTGPTGPNEYNSLVTPFELQANSPQATLPDGVSELARDADLHYVGATATRRSSASPSPINNSTIYFAINTWQPWSTPATEEEFDVYIDTNNDGTDDYVAFNTRFTDTDVFVTALQKLSGGGAVSQGFTNAFSSNLPSAVYNNDVLFMPVNVTGSSSGLAFPSGVTRFHYHVVSFSRFWGQIDSTPTLTYDYANPGIDFSGGAVGAPTVFDVPGGTIPAAYNQSVLAANGTLGVLLFHHYNATGTAQVLPLLTPSATTTTVDNISSQYSDPFTLTAHVSPTTNGTHSIAGSVEFFVNGVSVGSAAVSSSGTATLGGVANSRAAGPYNVTATYTSSSAYFTGSSTASAATLTVTKEDASVSFGSGNPAALQVSSPGGTLNANALTLTVTVKEKQPDQPTATSAAGDIGKADLTLTLTPIAGGSAITLTCTSSVSGSGYSAVKTFVCKNSSTLSVNTYEVGATVAGNYYQGSDTDAFTVYDPSLGFATGGGTFILSGDKVNFGFTMKYNKGGTNLQGTFIAVRHHADGTNARMKSNSLGGLALQNTGGCGIATWNGKSTYTYWDPTANSGAGGYVTTGNNPFTAYAEDCNNPGTGVDSMWIGGPGEFAMPTPAGSNKKTLNGGNIAIPHTK
jgi:subtilisin family serine protease